MGAPKKKKAAEGIAEAWPVCDGDPGRLSNEGISNDRLRNRYEELRAIRETKPESEALAARVALEKVVDGSEKLVKSLREEIAQLKEAKPEASDLAGQPTADELAAAKAAAEELRLENDELKQRLKAAEAAAAIAAAAPAPAPVMTAEAAAVSAEERGKRDFYEMMTGMTVELDGSGKKARCVISAVGDAGGDKRRAVFNLDLAPEDGEAEDVEYVPTDLSGCVDRLPEYLRDSIMCTPRAARRRAPKRARFAAAAAPRAQTHGRRNASPPLQLPPPSATPSPQPVTAPTELLGPHRPRAARAAPPPRPSPCPPRTPRTPHSLTPAPVRAVERSQAPAFTQRLLAGVAAE